MVCEYLVEGGGEIIIDHVGNQTLIARMLGNEWQKTARGKVVSQSHSDREFEDSVCVPYWDAFKDGQPYYDHVRALVYLDDRDSVWLSYQRLILPVGEPGKPLRLCVFVAPTQDVSIPPMNSVGLVG